MNYPSWIDKVIILSSKAGGMGMSSSPEYYSGCSVCRHRTSPEKLFVLYQEFLLQEALGEIPVGSARAYAHLIRTATLMRPDSLLKNIARFAKGNYKVTNWLGADARPTSRIGLLADTISRSRRDVVKEKWLTEEIKNKFCHFVSECPEL